MLTKLTKIAEVARTRPTEKFTRMKQRKSYSNGSIDEAKGKASTGTNLGYSSISIRYQSPKSM